MACHSPLKIRIFSEHLLSARICAVSAIERNYCDSSKTGVPSVRRILCIFRDMQIVPLLLKIKSAQVELIFRQLACTMIASILGLWLVTIKQKLLAEVFGR